MAWYWWILLAAAGVVGWIVWSICKKALSASVAGYASEESPDEGDAF